MEQSNKRMLEGIEKAKRYLQAKYREKAKSPLAGMDG